MRIFYAAQCWGLAGICAWRENKTIHSDLGKIFLEYVFNYLARFERLRKSSSAKSSRKLHVEAGWCHRGFMN